MVWRSERTKALLVSFGFESKPNPKTASSPPLGRHPKEDSTAKSFQKQGFLCRNYESVLGFA